MIEKRGKKNSFSLLGSKGREENNTFYPTQREKITHFAQRGSHSTTACAHAFFSRNQRSHDKNATLGFGRVMAGSPDSKCTVRAKHCWTHPSWGWVRSELSVLHPDVSCCLAKGEGRGGDYTTLSLSPSFLLAYTGTKCWYAKTGSGKPWMSSEREREHSGKQTQKGESTWHHYLHFTALFRSFRPRHGNKNSTSGRMHYSAVVSFWAKKPACSDHKLTPWTACQLKHADSISVRPGKKNNMYYMHKPARKRN